MADNTAPITGNAVSGISAASNADSRVAIPLLADSVTQRLLVDAGSITIGGITGTKSNNAVVPGATNLGVLGGVATAAAPSYTEGFQVALSTDLSGNLRTTTTIAANSSVNLNQVGGVSVATGNGVAGTGVQRVTIASDNTAFAVNATLSAETTKVIGVVRTADGSGNLLTSTTNALDVNLKTSALSNLSTNVAQINGVTPLMGNGVTGTGSQRVTIASDNTAFSVNATLSAETTKVIGVVRNADGSGNLLTSTANALDVNIKTSAASNISTNTAQIGGTTIVNGGVAGSQSIGGTVATNVAINANPVNLGVQAISSENSAVTTARQVQLVADLVGKLITLPYANPENFVSGVTAAITDTTNTSVIASAGGSLRNYVTQILVTNSHATVSTVVEIRDGATTVLYRGYALAAGGGFSVTLPVPLRGTAATAVTASCITTGSNVYVSASGYKGV